MKEAELQKLEGKINAGYLRSALKRSDSFTEDEIDYIVNTMLETLDKDEVTTNTKRRKK